MDQRSFSSSSKFYALRGNPPSQTHPPLSALEKHRTYGVVWGGSLSPDLWGGREELVPIPVYVVTLCWVALAGEKMLGGGAGDAGCVEEVEECKGGYSAQYHKLALNLRTTLFCLLVDGEGHLKVSGGEEEMVSQPSTC